MGIEDAIGASYEALIVIIKITTPVLVVTTVLGLLMTIFQQVTNINESTLQQDLKIFATLVMLFVTGPAIFIALRDYTFLIFDRIASIH